MLLSTENGIGFDRKAELKAFDATKAGVKGLLDAGLERVPLIFNRAWAGFNDHDMESKSDPTSLSIPLIDLQGIEMDPARRSKVVQEVQEASKRWGFFQIINHGIPVSLLDEMLQVVRRFHEQETDIRKAFYSRDRSKMVYYNTNFDLFSAPTANWRDTLNVLTTADPERLPEVCRDVFVEYSKQVKQLGYTLLELISEALGLKPNHLKELQCAADMPILGHYYPSCPEPELTIGSAKHTDNDFFTLLQQDQVGGLQVLHENKWVDIHPLLGALIVNYGDLLQVLSNDQFKSINHRVLSKREGPRISVATFFRPHDVIGNESTIFGPIPDLLSEENPPVFQNFSLKEYMEHFLTKGLDGTSALTPFRIQNAESC